MKVFVPQLGLTLYDPMDYSPPGSSVHGDSPGKNTGVAGHAHPQGIYQTLESNPGLLPRRLTLYHLSYCMREAHAISFGQLTSLSHQAHPWSPRQTPQQSSQTGASSHSQF